MWACMSLPPITPILVSVNVPLQHFNPYFSDSPGLHYKGARDGVSRWGAGDGA